MMTMLVESWKQYSYANEGRLAAIPSLLAFEESLNEDFEDGVANDWVKASGTWAIETDGTKVYSGSKNNAGTDTTWYSPSQGGTFSNFTYKAKVKLLAGGAQLLMRYDGTSSIAVTLSSTALTIQGCGKSYSVGKSPGSDWHDIKVEASGSTFKVYYENVVNPDIQASDFTCLKRGKVGLGVTSSSGGPHAHFDNIVVEPVDTFQYDANGNLLIKDVGPSWSFKYDYEDRLVEVRKDGALQASYVYDGLGRRIKATESGTTTHTLYQGIAPMHDWTSTTQTDYIYANGLLIAKVSGTTVNYFHQDALGSTRLVTDASANTVFETHYKPFGIEYGTSGSDPSFKYTGQRKDATGLYYLNARQYDPETGRFIQQDPVLGSLQRPQSLNRYAYVVNNPLNYVDPQGLAESLPCVIETAPGCKGYQERVKASLPKTSEERYAVMLVFAISAIGLIGPAGWALGTIGVGAGLAGKVTVTAIARRAITGATSFAAMDVIMQYLMTGQIDWTQVAAAATMGAILNAFGLPTFRLTPGYIAARGMEGIIAGLSGQGMRCLLGNCEGAIRDVRNPLWWAVTFGAAAGLRTFQGYMGRVVRSTDPWVTPYPLFTETQMTIIGVGFSYISSGIRQLPPLLPPLGVPRYA